MKRKIKIVLILIVATCFVFNVQCFAESAKVTQQTSQFYVNDFANIFTDEQENEMVNLAASYAETTGGIQVVITTVKNLNETVLEGKASNINDVGYTMYNQYAIGKDSMGVLVLLSIEDRDICITTGYKMEEYITDSRAGKLIDKYAMDSLSNNEFDKGLISLQEGIITYLKSNVPEDWANSEIKSSDNSNLGLTCALIILFLFIIVGICVLIYYINKKSNSIKREIDYYKYRISQLTNENNQLSQTISSLNKKFVACNNLINEQYSRIDTLSKKWKKICKLYPNRDFEQEIDKADADELGKKIAEIYGDKPEISKIPLYAEWIDILSSQPDNIMKYYTSITKEQLESRMIEALKMKEEEEIDIIKRRIRECVSNKNIHSDYKVWQEIYTSYNSLPTSAKEGFDLKLIEEFILLYESARDYNDAKLFTDELKILFKNIGNKAKEYDLIHLKSMREKYYKLSEGIKNNISKSLIYTLDHYISQAETDKQINDKARVDKQRKTISPAQSSSSNPYYRSQRRTTSSSSSTHRSHHTGFGGSSHGGGASRKF